VEPHAGMGTLRNVVARQRKGWMDVGVGVDEPGKGFNRLATVLEITCLDVFGRVWWTVLPSSDLASLVGFVALLGSHRGGLQFRLETGCLDHQSGGLLLLGCGQTCSHRLELALRAIALSASNIISKRHYQQTALLAWYWRASQTNTIPR
jgi:hypothetical protein